MSTLGLPKCSEFVRDDSDIRTNKRNRAGIHSKSQGKKCSSFFIRQSDIVQVYETFSAEEGLAIIGLCVFYFSQAEIQSSTTITKTKALQSSNHFPLLLLALLMRVVMRAPLRTPAPKRRPLLISSFLLMYGSSKSPAYIRLRGISHL